MAIVATAIFQAIEQLVDGTIGATRTVASAALRLGHFPWSGKTLSTPTFDVQIINTGGHPQTYTRATSNRRLDILDIQIDLRHHLKSNITVVPRREVRGLVQGDIDECKQALQYPGNLYDTDAGTATNIIGGLLHNLTSFQIEENWEDKRRRWIHTQITGQAWVAITQAV